MRVRVSGGRQSPVQAAQRHGVPLATGRASPAVRAPERAPAEERALLVAGLRALRAQHRLGQLRHPATVVRNLRTDLSCQVSGAESALTRDLQTFNFFSGRYSCFYLSKLWQEKLCASSVQLFLLFVKSCGKSCYEVFKCFLLLQRVFLLLYVIFNTSCLIKTALLYVFGCFYSIADRLIFYVAKATMGYFLGRCKHSKLAVSCDVWLSTNLFLYSPVKNFFNLSDDKIVYL